MKTVSLVIATIVLLLVPIAVIAQDATPTSDIGSGILGIVIAFVSTVLVAFGIGGVSLRSAIKKIHQDHVDFEEIDKAVEKMLSRIGIPKGISDIIGDIVAQVATRGPDLIGPPIMTTIKEIFIDEISRRSAMSVSALTENFVTPHLVSNRTSRVEVATALINSPMVGQLLKISVPT